MRVPSIAGVVARAYAENGFYRAKLDGAGVTVASIRTAHDLVRVPPTTRTELAGDPWALGRGAHADVVQVHVSSPVPGLRALRVPFTADDLVARDVRALVPALAGGAFHVLMGARVVTTLSCDVCATGFPLHRSLERAGACVVPIPSRADSGGTLRLLRALEASHLLTTPSRALLVAERAGGAVGGLASLWLTGEPCCAGRRREIERRWAAPAFLYAGALESGPIGLECGQRDGYHVATGSSHVELIPVDLPGRGDLAGLGEIVVTALRRRAAPLLRFRTGLLAVSDCAACGCGAPGGRLRLLGRPSDLLGNAGVPRFLGEVEDAMLAVPGVSPWVRVIPGPRPRLLLPSPTAQPVVARLRETLAAELGLRVDVDVVPLSRALSPFSPPRLARNRPETTQTLRKIP